MGGASGNGLGRGFSIRPRWRRSSGSRGGGRGRCSCLDLGGGTLGEMGG